MGPGRGNSEKAGPGTPCRENTGPGKLERRRNPENQGEDGTKRTRENAGSMGREI